MYPLRALAPFSSLVLTNACRIRLLPSGRGASDARAAALRCTRVAPESWSGRWSADAAPPGVAAFDLIDVVRLSTGDVKSSGGSSDCTKEVTLTFDDGQGNTGGRLRSLAGLTTSPTLSFETTPECVEVRRREEKGRTCKRERERERERERKKERENEREKGRERARESERARERERKRERESERERESKRDWQTERLARRDHLPDSCPWSAFAPSTCRFLQHK